MTHTPEWFVVQEGQHAGRAHLAGWHLTAFKSAFEDGHDNGWRAFGVCPRCYAAVIYEGGPGIGDNIWAHEQWHAQTDYPIPQHVLDAATR